MNTLGKIIEAQKQFLELLITSESEIASLYEVYSRCIPSKTEFWSSLAKEERKHAALLEASRSQLEAGEIFRGFGKVNTTDVLRMIEYIRERKLEAEHKAPQADYAVSVALEIESSLIDSKVLDLAHPEAKDFQEVTDRLAADTSGHVILVQEEKLAIERSHRRDEIPRSAPPPPLSR